MVNSSLNGPISWTLFITIFQLNKGGYGLFKGSLGCLRVLTKRFRAKSAHFTSLYATIENSFLFSLLCDLF